MRNRVKETHQRLVAEPVIVIVTHSALVEVVSDIWTGKRGNSFAGDCFCTLSQAIQAESGYQVKILGSYSHAPQSL
jgi:hypothetical protein